MAAKWGRGSWATKKPRFTPLREDVKAALREEWGLEPGRTVLESEGERYRLRDVVGVGGIDDDCPVVTAWKLFKNGKCYTKSTVLREWKVAVC